MSPPKKPEWDPGEGLPVRVAVTASKRGFEPEVAEFIRGRPGFLDFKRIDGTNCVTSVRMPWMDQPQDLPLGRVVSIQIPDTSQEGEFQYQCWMNMLTGKVVIRPPRDGG